MFSFPKRLTPAILYAAAGVLGCDRCLLAEEERSPQPFQEELQQALGRKVSLEAVDCSDYQKAQWSYHEGKAPVAVVHPSSTQDVVEVVKLCKKHKIPVIPYGSGTSLEGNAIPTKGGVMINFGNMDKILMLNVEDMDVEVEPGITWQDLNEQLASHGLMFAMDPGPGASIGGMVATGCSGTNAVRYGTMRDAVLALEVVTADGDVVKTRQRSRKSRAGYDLTSLMIGSEGTLGIVTKATLKLVPKPEASAVAVVPFSDVESAAKAVNVLVKQGVSLQCVELLDSKMIEILNSESGFEFPPQPHLFFKFSGTPASVKEAAERAQHISRAHKSGDFVWTLDPKEADRLWQARKVALWSTNAVKPESQVWITDVCVPISELPAAVKQATEFINSSGLIAPIVGHVGDGNFHVFILVDKENKQEMEAAERLNSMMVKHAIELGGSCTGEHGVGLGKVKFMEWEHTPAALNMMKHIKDALDPEGILNPGHVLPPHFSISSTRSDEQGTFVTRIP